jgi:Zn-dependent peptidase ImmA (M78 family)
MNLDQCADRALSHLDKAVRSKFAANPLEVLRNDLGLKVEGVDHLADRRDDGGACDGLSFLQDGVILYALTPYSRRENFTLAHELGHWLVEQVEELYDWLADQDDPPPMLETVCDQIAQCLLLPEEIVDSVVVEGPIRARHVLELYRASQASGPACSIALAKRLPHLGAVVIIDRAKDTVQYASVRPDPEEGWPVVFPWPGQAVPAGHPFKSMPSGADLTRKTFWRATWGSQEDYYIDAVSDDKRVIAVFSDIDVWGAERLHIDQPREFDRRPVTKIHCCGRAQTVRGYPCQDCGQPYCSLCGHCRCQRIAQKEQMCAGECFLRFQPHLLINGLCEECRS